MEKQRLYSEIGQFEPLFPSSTGELEDIAYELTQRSANLANQLAGPTLDGIRELLRVTNSYYSNLIEGNNTHPIEVERAMRADYSNDPAKRDRQQESVIHIDVQRKIEQTLAGHAEADVTSENFLRWIHREFYEQLPASRRVVEGDGEAEQVEAGQFRKRMVAVGKHLPPVAESIPSFMERFAAAYDPDRLHGTRKFVALAAAHHRLMWIHPFLDGNGRVARLFTDAFFLRIRLSGYGLWNVSRGLARRNADYRMFLDAADFPREDDLDGRGNLSDRTLTEFCKFFLEVCLDQTEYMRSVLGLDDFLDRLGGYMHRRVQGELLNERGEKAPPLHWKAGSLLREVAIMGKVPRGILAVRTEMGERSARYLLKSLIDEGLLVPTSDWHRSPLRLGFPPHAAQHWFPELFPPLTSRL